MLGQILPRAADDTTESSSMGVDLSWMGVAPTTPVLWDLDRMFRFPIPTACPSSLNKIQDSGEKACAEELWNAAVRLEVALGLLYAFPIMAENGGVIDVSTQKVISRILPVLSVLRKLLNELLHWPTLSRREVPLPPKNFPQLEFDRVTSAILNSIDGDARILAESRAIPWLQTPDGQRSLKGLSFDKRFAVRCGRGLDRKSNFLKVGQTHGKRQILLAQKSQKFRRSLEMAPQSTMSELTQSKSSIPKNSGDPKTNHTTDFAAVSWFGTDYRFTRSQRKVVASLWKAWEEKTQGVSAEDLINIARSSGSQLRDLFKGKGGMHAAWRTMIVGVKELKGLYRLNPPM